MWLTEVHEHRSEVSRSDDDVVNDPVEEETFEDWNLLTDPSGRDPILPYDCK